MTDDHRGHSFPRRLRLSGRRDFADTYAAQTRRPAGPLLVFARPNGLAFCRLGLSVARRVGSAPKRVRIKRLLREAFRLSRSELPAGYDLIVVVRKHEPLPLAEYRRLLAEAVGKLHRAWLRRGDDRSPDEPASETTTDRDADRK